MTIPIAFACAAEQPEDLPAVVRRRVRDAMSKGRILQRMVSDITSLLSEGEEAADLGNIVYLWDNLSGTVRNGINYESRDDAWS